MVYKALQQKDNAELQNSWSKLDKLLLAFGILVNFGDGMEIYLPGVVSQQISCEMKLTSVWESTLECMQYLTMAVSIVISGLLADRFGCRKVNLFSLYISTLSSVVCAIVANFTTLLLSRALIGFSVGLNYSIHGVMIGKLASNKAILDDILMISALMYSLGGVWSAVLGYLLLAEMGWRTFILVTSLPVFIPPIVMLHCSFQERTNGNTETQESNEIIPKEKQASVPNYVARITKLGIFCSSCSFSGWTTILLVPSLIQMFKMKEAEPNSDCSLTVTHGGELLLLGLVTSASIPGRVFIHFARKKVSFRKRQVLVSLLNVGCFVLMLRQENLPVAMTTNFIIKFLFGVTAMEGSYILYDESYFGTTGFALGCSIAMAAGNTGAVVGLALASFAPPFYVMISASVVSAVKIPAVFSMTEVQT